MWNVYYYMREARNPETIRTFAPDILLSQAEAYLQRASLSGGNRIAGTAGTPD